MSSGGQQQRVALARAFVIEPGKNVLLMDEPLLTWMQSCVQMRTVIKKLQRPLGITTHLCKTHDQEEARWLSPTALLL